MKDLRYFLPLDNLFTKQNSKNLAFGNLFIYCTSCY